MSSEEEGEELDLEVKGQRSKINNMNILVCVREGGGRREREEGEKKVPLPQIALDFRAKSNNSIIIVNHKLVIVIAMHTQRRKGYRLNCK